MNDMHERTYFTRGQTVAVVVSFLILNWVGEYFGFPLRFLRPAVVVPSITELPSSPAQPAQTDTFAANALAGKIFSIKPEASGTTILLALENNDPVHAAPQYIKIKVTSDTKITKRILKSKAEVDAINAKYAADFKKDPSTPLPVDALVASVQTLTVNDLKTGDSITVYPVESIVGKSSSELHESVAQFILLN